MGLLMLSVIIVAVIICGCSTTNNDEESHSRSMVLWANSYSSNSATQNLLTVFGCSNHDLSDVGTKSVVILNDTQLTMSQMSGSL